MSRQAALVLAPTCHLLQGKPVADEILAEVKREAAALAAAGRPPRLVSVTFGDHAAAEVYVRNQKRTAAKVGVEFVEVDFDPAMGEAEALAAIGRLNADPAVTGIILQRPLPRHLSVKRLQAAVDPSKDVEGMHPQSIGQIVYGLSDTGPCTALAAVELLKRTGLTIEGLEVVVIGHSEIVGKPIAFLLMAAGATVTVCHHMTRSVAMHARRADAVLVAVGKPKLVGPDMIKPGAAVIDIGINPVVGADGRSQVVGDVDFDAVRDVAGWLTPAPGGVGPVTLSILMRNTVRAAKRQLRDRPVPAPPPELDRILVRDLELMASIGVYAHEETDRQPIRVNLELEAERGGEGLGVVCYATVAEMVRALVAGGHIRLVEELAERIAEGCLADARVRAVRVRIEKLHAVAGSAGVGVEITRRRNVRNPQ
jgi:methylenetetrahydrofolate dehydrogenase (NADP+)/methenyltetrahydrofolate cyclohydrolase